ncbi:hypothetical protein KIN20_014343 [Parelaphostrongylus tenuis]|uniref:Uncharacterized protein n=1 Tax=Parelaphostrongylus tenuis TaxID=148309 RepID=A0AAD5MDH5_PARTN|nr:hypothetical protein KIN20_014343 [Parelaphostrongylus tenuis]
MIMKPETPSLRSNTSYSQSDASQKTIRRLVPEESRAEIAMSMGFSVCSCFKREHEVLKMEWGFELYAEHLGSRLGGPTSPLCEFLYERARPAWEKLTFYEQQMWTNRAVELARLDAQRLPFGTFIDYSRNSHYFYRPRRYQRAAQLIEHFHSLPLVADDDDEENQFCTVERLINPSEDGTGCSSTHL